MPDKNQNNQSNQNQPTEADASKTVDPTSTMSDVSAKIAEANNILIALSSNPTVDEISTAIGLSLYLDRAGKRTTAIYSGITPNALEFLNPEETLESTTDTLQDFVIAISKDKADHLRYKLDGDYVKIYITPYKSRIGEEDLDFSYGDFNVDLIIALNVKNGTDLDNALREHGRVMHDATIINITTDLPGKFGEIEWSDQSASSVSEMVAQLIYSMQQKVPVEKDEATAFLTGIVAATDRFSNIKTTPETMQIASKLMTSGANQQLISENITIDSSNQLIGSLDNHSVDDHSSLFVEHEEDSPMENPAPETSSQNDLLDDLKAAEVALSESTPDEPSTEKNIEPSTEFVAENSEEGTNKYGQMLEDALTEDANTTSAPITAPEISDPATEENISPAPITTPLNPVTSAVPEVASAPEINGVPEINYMPLPDDEVLPPPPTPPVNMSSPVMPPMPPMPPVEPTSTEPTVVEPTAVEPAINEPVTTESNISEPTLEPTPAEPIVPDQTATSNPQPTDPSAFKIPGI